MSEQRPDYTTRAQTIFRVEKNPDNPFVMIDRRPIENPKLSWKAKGLLAYLLSRPDNWIVRFRDLVNRSPDGAHTVRAAMKELRAAGHVKVLAEREKGRVLQWTYTIHESPDGDFQQVEKQQVENRTLNNNNKSLTKKKVKEGASAKPPTPPEVKLFREVKGRYPNQATYELVTEKIQKMSARLLRPVTKDDLRPFYVSWTSKGYNPENLAWLDWAVSGIVPANAKIANVQEPRGFEGVRRFIENMQKEEVFNG